MEGNPVGKGFFTLRDLVARIDIKYGNPLYQRKTLENIQDLLDKDPQLKDRGFFPILEHSEQGPCLHMRMPVRLSGTPDDIGPAPCLGEHTEYVCSEVLGMPDDEFLQLLADGVLA